MRDPKRITPLLRKIERLWRQYPDLRFGQLLENCVLHSGELYHLEDNVLMTRLDEVYLTKE